MLSVDCTFSYTHTLITVSFHPTVIGEDFLSFQVNVPVSTSVTSGDTICALNANMAILDDDIVEPDQSFEMSIVGSSIPDLVQTDGSVLEVVIVDDTDGWLS